MKRLTFAVLGALLLLDGAEVRAYPTDEFERTQMRRLKWQQAVNAGEKRGSKIPAGAQWPTSKVRLRLSELGKDYRLTAETPKDPALQAGLEAILKRGSFKRYNVAIVDITDPAAVRWAGVHETDTQTPGSVAKVLAAAGLFEELKQRFPQDLAAREAFLRDTKIVADDWSMPNSHEVPVIDAAGNASIRRVFAGDTFSLWEWLDHALSPSSNAAGTTVWREAILMRLLGPGAYPPAAYDGPLYARWDKPTFSAAAFDVLDKPLRDAGLDPASFSLRLFFTKGPSKYLDNDESRTSPLALVQWMLAVEQGRMVDAWSSLELKKLLYLTRRRVRYAKAPELKEAAVYFKSGSLFECAPEEGFTCVQYQGNVVNVLNALVEVEAEPPAAAAIPAAPTPPSAPEAQKAPAPPETPVTTATSAPSSPKPTTVYIVAVMSNELKRNAAEDHAKLASALHELVQRR